MTLTENMLCAKTHEYVVEVEKGTYQIGLTEYAIDQLGDIVFVELPEVGAEFGKNEVFATVESVKAASEIYMPISGKVIDVNENIVDSPEILNEKNYDDSWLIKISTDADTMEFSDLLEYNDYLEEVK